MISRLAYKIRIFTEKLARKVQDWLITVLLTLTYFIVFGFSKLAIVVFYKKILYNKTKHSSWVDAKGYSPNIKDYMRQS